MCLPPWGSTGPPPPMGCGILSQQVCRGIGGREMNHVHEWQQNTQFTVNRGKMLLRWAGCRKWWCEEKAYPVNHQKRIFDRKEASLTGHGFWNISNNRLTAVFTINDLIIKAEPLLLARVICKSGFSLSCYVQFQQYSFPPVKSHLAIICISHSTV